MQLPVKISYRGLEKSDQIDNFVLDKAARLEKFCDHINRCDVAIEQPNHTHHKGNQYRVRIDVTVSRGHELVANEQQKDNGTHDPLNNKRRIAANASFASDGGVRNGHVKAVTRVFGLLRFSNLATPSGVREGQYRC